MNDKQHRSGYVALIGRPNAGKSTLLNRILGQKLVAVTPKPQTTRHRIFGIYDQEDVQAVFQDTPGLLEANDAMHQFMMREASRALQDADVAVWLIDGIKGMTNRDCIIANQRLSKVQIPLIAVFNKMDKAPMTMRAGLSEQLEKLEIPEPHSVEYISALHGDGVDSLLEQIVGLLPFGPKFYPPDQLSDRTQRFFVEEIIREQAFMLLRDEVPYSLTAMIDSMKERPDGLTEIEATLHVERDTQKGIIVGKNGAMIKRIGTNARIELQELLGGKVFLKLWVKVTPNWRKKGNRLKEFGYQEEM